MRVFEKLAKVRKGLQRYFGTRSLFPTNNFNKYGSQMRERHYLNWIIKGLVRHVKKGKRYEEGKILRDSQRHEERR